jgi:hypothetical protein
MMCNGSWYANMVKKVEKAHVSIYLFSIIWFIFGVYILQMHSSFSSVLEWFAFLVWISLTIKSSLYLLTPWVMQKITKDVSKHFLKLIRYIAPLYILIWIYISYIAYR